MNLLQEMKVLNERDQPFVLATVVRVEKPASAKPGAKAIVRQDGSLHGWIGGSCTEPSVIRESLKALTDGEPRILRITPPEKMGRYPQEGVNEVTLTCASGGTLEIYLEPYLTQPHLVVIGHQAVAEALVNLGKGLDYPVTIVGENVSQDRFPLADRLVTDLDFSKLELTTNSYVVIASHGNYDEPALEAALSSPVSYIALVASKKRALSIREYLLGSGITDEQLARLKYPAGLDFGALTPQEIALSILAEIIQLHRRDRTGKKPESGSTSVLVAGTAVDPVCGMTVETGSITHSSAYCGKTYYFCSVQCLHRFEKEPEKFLHFNPVTEQVS